MHVPRLKFESSTVNTESAESQVHSRVSQTPLPRTTEYQLQAVSSDKLHLIRKAHELCQNLVDLMLIYYESTNQTMYYALGM